MDATSTTPAALARATWPLVETAHALVYWAPEHRAEMDALGLKGGWMAYFAGRAAPMGEVAPPVVTATFHGFHARMVERAVGDCWRLGGGAAAVLAARGRAADAAMRRLLGPLVDAPRVERAAEVAWALAAGAPTHGRVLGAANQALARPTAPHAVLWQACTTLREHRGDGHVVALTAHGVDGASAHVLKVAGGADRSLLQPNRGFTDEEWAAAVAGLTGRGALDDAGRLTDDGHALVAAVEQRTDALAGEAYADLDVAAADQLHEDLRWLADRLIAADAVPFPNPIGVPRPV